MDSTPTPSAHQPPLISIKSSLRKLPIKCETPDSSFSPNNGPNNSPPIQTPKLESSITTTINHRPETIEAMKTIFVVLRLSNSTEYGPRLTRYDICGAHNDGKLLNCPFGSPVVKETTMASKVAARYVSRRLSSSGKVLSEEEKAAENVYIKIGWGQKGGMLNLVGKLALLWGGIRGVVSLTDKLISFLRLAEHPLLQSYEDWGVDELIVEGSWKRQVWGD